MAGTNSHRIIGTIPTEWNNRDNISVNEMQQTIKEAVQFPLEIQAMNWFSVYKLHHRSVESFTHGNCFLAGDAAHIHSPAGGQGMNTGLQDAYNLSWKLAYVIKGIADKKLLDTYNEERLPFAHWLLKFTDRAFAAMTSSNPVISWIRNNIFPVFVNMFLQKKAVTSAMFDAVSQIQWSYSKNSISENRSSQKLKFNAGDRLPYILLNNGGTTESVYKKLTAASFHLLIIGNVSIKFASNESIKVIHLGIDEWKAVGVEKPVFILTRPDNYIALIADKLDEKELQSYLKEKCFFNA